MDYRQEINAIKHGLFLKIPVIYTNKYISHENLDSSDAGNEDGWYKETLDSISFLISDKKKDFEFEVTSNVSITEQGNKIDEIYVNGGFKGEAKITADISSRNNITKCSTGNAEIDIALKARHAVVNSHNFSINDSGQDTWLSDDDFKNKYPELCSANSSPGSQLQMEVGVCISNNDELEVTKNLFEDQYPNLDFVKTSNVIELMKKSRVNSNKMLSILSKFSGEAQANIIYFGLKKSPEELHKFIDKNYERLFPERSGLQPKTKSVEMSL